MRAAKRPGQLCPRSQHAVAFAGPGLTVGHDAPIVCLQASAHQDITKSKRQNICPLGVFLTLW